MARSCSAARSRRKAASGRRRVSNSSSRIRCAAYGCGTATISQRCRISVDGARSKEADMAVNKAHDEFYTLDLKSGWETLEGYPPGIQQKIIAGGLDERHRRGS